MRSSNYYASFTNDKVSLSITFPSLYLKLVIVLPKSTQVGINSHFPEAA